MIFDAPSMENGQVCRRGNFEQTKSKNMTHVVRIFNLATPNGAHNPCSKQWRDRAQADEISAVEIRNAASVMRGPHPSTGAARSQRR